jgi:uncharacterized protein YcbX
MTLVGRVDSLWRYPVKSMRGEQLTETFLAPGGVAGDRLYAFRYSRARKEFPYLTAREQPAMLQYQPHCKPGSPTLFVNSPQGEHLSITDTRLISLLSESIPAGESVGLMQSDHAMADCHAVSIFSIQTARQLGEELHTHIDLRRFRANIYVDLFSKVGFGEDEFVGHSLLIGSTAVVKVIELDQRCKIITLDPFTSVQDPNVIKQVARAHDGAAGIYGEVLVEGTVRCGDAIALLP